MKCNICQSLAEKVFEKKILKKYNANYFRCKNCGFLFTEDPYWLDEAYEERIKGIRDTGMVQRNIDISDMISRIIHKYFDSNGTFIDYGAGTGLFVRLMRDRGFEFYYDDPYAKNIFSRCFEAKKHNKIDEKNELLTAIEVFEHSADPTGDVKEMFKYSESIFFTTELQPMNPINLEWWPYLLPDSGQHVSFYTMKSLEKIATNYSANLHSDGKSTHLLTRRVIKNFKFKSDKFQHRAMRWLGRKLQAAGGMGIKNGCLINSDYADIERYLKLIK